MKIGCIAFVALLSTCPSWCCDCFDISDGYCCSASIEEKRNPFINDARRLVVLMMWNNGRTLLSP